MIYLSSAASRQREMPTDGISLYLFWYQSSPVPRSTFDTRTPRRGSAAGAAAQERYNTLDFTSKVVRQMRTSPPLETSHILAPADYKLPYAAYHPSRKNETAPRIFPCRLAELLLFLRDIFGNILQLALQHITQLIQCLCLHVIVCM